MLVDSVPEVFTDSNEANDFQKAAESMNANYQHQ